MLDLGWLVGQEARRKPTQLLLGHVFGRKELASALSLSSGSWNGGHLPDVKPTSETPQERDLEKGPQSQMLVSPGFMAWIGACLLQPLGSELYVGTQPAKFCYLRPMYTNGIDLNSE